MGTKLNLIGMTFGRLTVISRAESRPEGKARKLRVWWNCQCECGNEVAVCGKKLVGKIGNRTLSCGCLHNEKQFPGVTYSPVQRILVSYIQNAKRRNLVWEISEELGAAFLAGKCHYCGVEPSLGLKSNVTKRPRRDSFAYNGIDRLDPSVGYIEGNCVSCCSACNYFKAGRTDHDFLRLITNIYRHAVLKEKA